MSSCMLGKPEVKAWILDNIEEGSRCLDVGACDGIWANLLGSFLSMDAVEVYEPNVIRHNLALKYKCIMVEDIRKLAYSTMYELIIFGDVIEHMTVEDAKNVLAYAKDHAKYIIVAVPFKYKQGAIYGNEYERHIQDDLTHELFMERYPGFERLFLFQGYGYYLWHEV